MKYPVLIKEDRPNHYTATVLAMPDCKAEGASEGEALDRVKQAIDRQLRDGKVVHVEVSSPSDSENPWAQFAGFWKDDPDFDELMTEIEAYRRSVEVA